MKIAVISFTEKGDLLAEKVFGDWENDAVQFSGRFLHNTEVPDRKNWVREQFEEKNALVFIGAAGIAVRMVAPYISDKTKDSPVLVMDEAGTFVIPILSGHLGGANELAGRIAVKMGAIPVLTTASDVEGTFAVDEFAKKSRLRVLNKEGIAKISSRVLRNEMVDIVISPDMTQLSHGILRLKPKELILGVGCRKGKSYEELREFIGKHLKAVGADEEDVFLLASIDLKKGESCLVKWTNSHRIPFYTYSAEELAGVTGEFESSRFVEEKVGVNNVCERAAKLAAGSEGEFLLRKQTENGMTLCIIKKNWKLETCIERGYEIDED